MLTQLSPEAQDIPKASQSYGGSLIWGVCHKPTLINPIFTTYSISATLMELIFNRLVRINSKGEIGPDLAGSWDVSSDGLVYTFYLRKGVKFHDGTECTAQDVKFTYDKILDSENNSPYRTSLRLVKDLKVIDKYTFRIALNKPSASFIYRLTREILPRHLLEDADLKKCSFNFHPIGTGPFRFKQWTREDEITLEFNPDYYEGRPNLDKIIVKTYPDSRDMWTALMRNEVDFALFIEREDYKVVKEDPSFKAYAIPADSYYAIVYDPSDPTLADRRVREAIAYGIDRESLIERAASGYGLECYGPFYPESLGFNPEIKVFEYSPEKSLRLLVEAGWEDLNNDGILEKDGEELEIRVLVDARNDVYRRLIMVLRQQLQEIGIRIKAVLYDDEGMFMDKEFIKKSKPQVHLKSFLAGIDPEEGIEYWFSKESRRDNKLWIYRNEEVDRLIELGEVVKNKVKRQEIYQGIHKLVYEDQPACFLYFPFGFHTVSSKFENVDEYFTLSMPTYTMKDWYIIKEVESSE